MEVSHNQLSIIVILPIILEQRLILPSIIFHRQSLKMPNSSSFQIHYNLISIYHISLYHF